MSGREPKAATSYHHHRRPDEGKKVQGGQIRSDQTIAPPAIRNHSTKKKKIKIKKQWNY